MSKSIRQRLLEGADEPPSQWSRFSTLSEGDKEEAIEACRELTNVIYEGLDLAGEIREIETQDLGDMLLLWDDARLVGFAACHHGAGTEAGSGACFIKFGAIRPGHKAGENFERLLDSCEELGASLGAQLLTGGRIWAATKRIARCASMDSAQTSNVLRCSDRTIRVTTFPGST